MARSSGRRRGPILPPTAGDAGARFRTSIAGTGDQFMSAEDEVRRASAEFYAALNRVANGDSGAMAQAWSREGTATTMHPIGGCERGLDEVLGSFVQVAGLASRGHVEIESQKFEVAGDLAYEIGHERGRITLGSHEVTVDHRVTNIYRRGAAGWKIVHHHTDVSPAMVQVLGRVQAGH